MHARHLYAHAMHSYEHAYIYNAANIPNCFQENGTVSIQRPSNSSPEAVGFLRALMIPVS